METSRLEASRIPLSLKFPCPLTVAKRAVRLASLPGPLDFARAAISASATKPTGNWQAPDHFYPCLSIPCHNRSINMCMYTMTYLSFSCELWKMYGLLSQKCLADSGQSTGGPGVLLFFPSLDFCIDVQRNSRLLHRGHRIFQGNVKLKMLKLQEPPFEWNDAYCIFSLWSTAWPWNLYILSYLQKDKELQWLAQQLGSINLTSSHNWWHRSCACWTSCRCSFVTKK